jgi:hypothetical protein
VELHSAHCPKRVLKVPCSVSSCQAMPGHPVGNASPCCVAWQCYALIGCVLHREAHLGARFCLLLCGMEDRETALPH